MTSKQIKKLAHRVESAIVRCDIYGNSWLTIWYGQIADAILIDSENEEAVKELLRDLEERNEKRRKN